MCKNQIEKLIVNFPATNKFVENNHILDTKQKGVVLKYTVRRNNAFGSKRKQHFERTDSEIQNNCQWLKKVCHANKCCMVMFALWWRVLAALPVANCYSSNVWLHNNLNWLMKGAICIHGVWNILTYHPEAAICVSKTNHSVEK